MSIQGEYVMKKVTINPRNGIMFLNVHTRMDFIGCLLHTLANSYTTGKWLVKQFGKIRQQCPNGAPMCLNSIWQY